MDSGKNAMPFQVSYGACNHAHATFTFIFDITFSFLLDFIDFLTLLDLIHLSDILMGISVIMDAPICTSAYGSTTGSYHPPSPYSATYLSPAPHTHLYEPLHSASASTSMLWHRMRPHTAGLADGLEEAIEEREGRDRREGQGLPPRAPALRLTRSACKSFTLGDRQSGSPMGLLFVLLFEPLSAALDLGSGTGTATAPTSSSGTRDGRTASELSSTSHGSNSSSSSSKVEGGLPWRRVMKHQLSVFNSAKKWVIKLLTTASLLLGAVERRGSSCTAAELKAGVLAFLRRHWIDFFFEIGGTEKIASAPPYGADKRSSDTHRSKHQRSEDRYPVCDYSELREYALAAWRECGGGAYPAVTRPLAHSHSPALFSTPSPTPRPLAPTSDHVQPHSGFPKSALRLEEEKGERSKQSRSILVVGLDRDLQEHLEGAGKRARQGRAILTGTGVDRSNVNTQSQLTDEDGTDKVVPGDEEHDKAPLVVLAGVNGGQEAADTAYLPSHMNIGQAAGELHNVPCEVDRAVEVEVEVEVKSLVGVGQGVDIVVHESEPACGNDRIAIETESVQVHQENSVVDLTSPITTAAVFDGLSPDSKAVPVCAADAPLPLPLLSASCEGSKCTVWEAESTGPGLSMGPSHTQLADLTKIPPLPATPETSATKAALALACSPRDKETTTLHTSQLPVTASPPPLVPPSSSSSPPLHAVQHHNVESNAGFLVPSKPLPMEPPSQPLPPPLPQSQSALGSFPLTPPSSNMRRDAVSSTNSDSGTSRTSPTVTVSVDPAHRLSLSVPPSTARLEERPLVEPFLYLLPSQRELFSRSQNSAVRNSQELTRTGEGECGSGSIRGVINIGIDEVPLDDAEESKIEEISSQLVFLPHRASRYNNNSSSSGVPHSSTLRVGRSLEVVHEGGRSKKRMLSGSQDHPRLSQEVEGYNVKRTLNGYIATADSVASSLMSVLNCTDGEGRYGSERLRNSVPDSAEMGIVVGGVAVAGDPVMRCSSPLTLIREALEANHRVNGRLLELSRRYQEDLVL